MRFEEKLDLGITAEEVASAESPADVRPNQRAAFDAIKRFLEMDIDDLWDFATKGGYIEEGNLVIAGMPAGQVIVEEIVNLTVETGNYTRVIEITIRIGQTHHRTYIIAPLSAPDSKINALVQSSMDRWVQDGGEFHIPLPYFDSKSEALKAMGEIESKAAQQAPTPIKPGAKQPSAKKTPAVDVKQVAIQVATKMGKKHAIPVIQKMSARDLREAARRGKATTNLSAWTIGKITFLIYLGIQALYQGAAGIAALLIGVFAVFYIDATRQK